MAHGSGGRLSHELISQVFAAELGNPILAVMDDAAVMEVSSGRLAFTTDSFVVDPIFFPGGDIGRLAVCGTVNDLAMAGAIPKYLSLAFILEEGLPLEDLRRIVASIARTAGEAQVLIVTGDTKVVNRGGADKVFINTAGIGFVPPGVNVSCHNLKIGDKIIVSGPVGEHGLAIMARRGNLALEPPIASDVAPLGSLVQAMLGASPQVHALRDPTRGGVATTLNELARQSSVGIAVDEERIPVRPEVRGACELLGLDPLYLGNEGKLLAAVAAAAADDVLQAMQRHPLGRQACIIGEVMSEPRGVVLLRTRVGGTRLLDMLTGEQLPRIC